MLKQLFVASARCQLFVAKTAPTAWVNLVLKQWDAVLTKIKDSILFEPFMDLRNFPCRGPPSFSQGRLWRRSLKNLFMYSQFSFNVCSLYVIPV